MNLFFDLRTRVATISGLFPGVVTVEGLGKRCSPLMMRRLFAYGLAQGRFVFDAESAEWVRTIIDTALRPRRGELRVVTAGSAHNDLSRNSSLGSLLNKSLEHSNRPSEKTLPN